MLILTMDSPLHKRARPLHMVPHRSEAPAGRAHLGHEAPLQARGEARAAAATQAGLLHLVHNPVGALGHQVLCAVPVAARQRALPAPPLTITACTPTHTGKVHISKLDPTALATSTHITACTRALLSSYYTTGHRAPALSHWGVL